MLDSWSFFIFTVTLGLYSLTELKDCRKKRDGDLVDIVRSGTWVEQPLLE